MRTIAIALVAAAFGVCQSQTLKTVNALCGLDEVDGMIRMSFRLAMNGEPQGVLHAIDWGDFEQTIEIYTALTGCGTSYDNVNGVWTMDTSIDIGTGQITNGCGMRTVDPPGINNPVYYEWLLLQMDNEDGLLDINDRVYRVRCTQDNFLSNIVYANVNVQTPNLNQGVTYLDLEVIYQVLVYDGTGNVDDVTNYALQGTAFAGDWAKLRLIYRRGTSYSSATHPFGAWCKNTYAGPLANNPNQGAVNDFLMDIYGCPYDGDVTRRHHTSNQVPPYIVESEYLGYEAAGGSEYHVTSGKFRLWSYTQANSNTVYFSTAFTFFDIANQNNLDNSCQWYVSQLRRKRSEQDPVRNEGMASVQIRIVVDDQRGQNTADASSDRQVAVIIGAVSGAAVVMLVAGCICLGLLLCGKRRRERKCKDSRTSSTISIVPQKA